MRKEVETAFHAQAERWLNSMDLVKREEFDVVRDMALKAREENELLQNDRDPGSPALGAGEVIARQPPRRSADRNIIASPAGP